MKTNSNISVPRWSRRFPTTLVREGLLLMAAYFGYAFTKTLIHEEPGGLAFRNAWDLATLELRLGILREPAIQRWILDHARFVVYFSNWFYTLGYWPFILPMAFLIWKRNRQNYATVRSVALIAFGIVLIIYAAYPLAPPRMLPGFADTLLAFPAYQGANDSPLVNPYAAMPSVHYGLVLLVSIALYLSGGVWWKSLAVLYQGLMLAAIIVTGNHFFLDIVAAIAVMAIAFALWKGLLSLARGPLKGLRGAYGRPRAEPT